MFFPQWAHDAEDDCGLRGGEGGTCFLSGGGEERGDEEGGSDGGGGVWHSPLAIMLKLRRSINQTLQGAPPSCESPRILPLAPCVPPEDVPPTRIHRTARDGAHSVKPMAHPGAPLRARLRVATVYRLQPRGSAAPDQMMSAVEMKRVNPFNSHVNVNTTDATPGGTAAQRGDGRTFQTLPRHVYGFFRRRYAHNIYARHEM